ncbi:MAG TPA: hypothetical protein VFQ73_14640 [Flavisolibacter sp.]|nr:hypothetical protein [Flavisolibacter sp.]
MSNKIKPGLYFGLAMTFFFLFKTIIAWVTGEEQSTSEIAKSVMAAIVAGIVSGLLFGWLTGKFLISSIFTKSTQFQLDEGEVAIFQTPANHFKGMEGVGGSLCLTDRRLLFKSHDLNIQNHQLSIPLFQVQLVDRYKTLGLMNNGLAVHLKGNITERFVVDKANHWVEHMERTKNGLQPVHSR